MVDDNDDSTLAAAKREQLYTSADYGKLASMLKYDSTQLDTLFTRLVTCVTAAETSAVITTPEADEARAFIQDLTLSIYPPASTAGVHEGIIDSHLCTNCTNADHTNCQLRKWCSVNDVSVPCVCLQQGHTLT